MIEMFKSSFSIASAVPRKQLILSTFYQEL